MKGVMASVFCEDTGTKTPSNNALETGFIDEGNASGPTGSAAWYDTSLGVDYGNGDRFAREETYGMAKVPSRHKRD